jgi:hypothetical protein
MTHAAIICIMTLRAFGADVSRVILIIECRNFIFLFIVAGAAIFLSIQTLPIFFVFDFMVARDAGFTHIFTGVKFVIKCHQARVVLNFHSLGYGRHDATRCLKSKTLPYVAGIASDLNLHLLVAINAVSPNKSLMGRIFAVRFRGFSKIVAGTTVHFTVCGAASFLVIVMAIGAVGKGGMVRMIENHITSSSVKPDPFGGIRGPGKRIPYDAYNHTGNQDGYGKNLFDFVKHAFLFQDQND